MNKATMIATIVIVATVGLLVSSSIDVLFSQSASAVGRCPTPANPFPDNHINHGWSATQQHCR